MRQVGGVDLSSAQSAGLDGTAGNGPRQVVVVDEYGEVGQRDTPRIAGGDAGGAVKLGHGLLGVEAQQEVAAVVAVLPLELRVPLVVDARLRQRPGRQYVARGAARGHRGAGEFDADGARACAVVVRLGSDPGEIRYLVDLIVSLPSLFSSHVPFM